MSIQKPRLIHLLYVPTLACNLNCSYCYLEEKVTRKTLARDPARRLPSPVETLRFAVAKFQEAGIVPFNVSLHGGEPTLVEPRILEELFQFIRNYYEEKRQILTENGFTKKDPHIKTNLYNFEERFDLLEKYHVSVSASIDLPLSLHEKYRVTHAGSSLKKILQNLHLLSQYPHKKKFSSVIYQEHYALLPQILADIWKIHREIGFDMNAFNFMFGFETKAKALERGESVDLRPLTDTDQVDFFHRIHNEFAGTELEKGLQKMWFEEFTPSYCTNSANCGEKFFLLQFNGDLYSCVRGQGREEFYFGNIFEDSVKQIMENAYAKIHLAHINSGFDEKCMDCDYLALCKTGCPFVKREQNLSRSYTCELQKAIYRLSPEDYKPFPNSKAKKAFLTQFLYANHPQKIFEKAPSLVGKNTMILSSDFHESKNTLGAIIQSDPILEQIYSSDSVLVEVDQKRYPLESQILKKNRSVLFLNPANQIQVLIRQKLFEANCHELVRNTLYLMCLRDTKVTYGDEQRLKQEHLFTYQIYYHMLEEKEKDFFSLDITTLLAYHAKYFVSGVLNNLFITTSFLRDYHYQKQKDNAFYHIQAINLPFANIEFYWNA